MLKALTPFWIYWGILIAGCILFFYIPLVFFIFLPMLLVIIPVWALIVYQIGKAVQKKSGFEKMSSRILLSLFCTALTILIFPACSFVYDTIQWNRIHPGSFTNNFKDRAFWIISAVHFLIFWAAEESIHT